MSEAPERIWAFYTPDDFDDTATITAYETVQHGGKEYCRADLPPTISAAMELPEVQALTHAVASQIAYMDMCGDYGDLYNRLTAALAAIKEPKT